jgi:hypothetical protein
MTAIHIDPYTLVIARTCQECGQEYSIDQFTEDCESYFHKPVRYIDGCEQFCLSCWLCVGPNDDGGKEPRVETVAAPADIQVEAPHNEFRHGRFQITWPFDDVYEGFTQGNVIDSYRWFFDNGWQLAVLPLTRVKIINPLFFPNGGAIFPPQVAQLDALHPRSNRRDSEDRAELCSAVSGIELSTLEQHPVVVLPCRFNWESFIKAGHREQLGLVRELSELVDGTFLDFMRYWKCRLDSTDALPSHAGQTKSNPRMAGALVYDANARESRIIGGAAFTHAITDGLGMAMTQPEWNEMATAGEVGNIVEHGLFLYANALESPSQTAKFMQAVALLDYLAFPSEFRPLKKVRAVVVRYAAKTPQEHDRLTKRFQNDLFGPTGYRTQIVHNGKRLEHLIPSRHDRDALFRELDGYVRNLVGDMINHSEMTWAEYTEYRKTIGLGQQDAEEE